MQDWGAELLQTVSVHLASSMQLQPTTNRRNLRDGSHPLDTYKAYFLRVAALGCFDCTLVLLKIEDPDGRWLDHRLGIVVEDKGLSGPTKRRQDPVGQGG